jgi:hypothetical protein
MEKIGIDVHKVASQVCIRTDEERLVELRIATTHAILVAIRFEERDLIAAHPEYASYRARVPMLIPGGGASEAERPARGVAPAGAGGTVGRPHA